MWWLHSIRQEKWHIGPKQLILHFAIKYYNPNICNIASATIIYCDVCARVKPAINKYGTLGTVGPAESLFEIVHIDTKSGFKGYGTKKEHQHIAIDSFTRFVWIRCLHHQNWNRLHSPDPKSIFDSKVKTNSSWKLPCNYRKSLLGLLKEARESHRLYFSQSSFEQRHCRASEPNACTKTAS